MEKEKLVSLRQDHTVWWQGWVTGTGQGDKEKPWGFWLGYRAGEGGLEVFPSPQSPPRLTETALPVLNLKQS